MCIMEYILYQLIRIIESTVDFSVKRRSIKKIQHNSVSAHMIYNMLYIRIPILDIIQYNELSL